MANNPELETCDNIKINILLIPIVSIKQEEEDLFVAKLFNVSNIQVSVDLYEYGKKFISYFYSSYEVIERSVE